MACRVGDWLSGAGLSHFTGSFSDVDETKFLSMQMGDYASYQVTSIEDRKKLFSLIQALKREGISPAISLPSDAPVRPAIPPAAAAAPAAAVQWQPLVPAPAPVRLQPSAAAAAPQQARPSARAPASAAVAGDGRDKSRIRVCVRKRPMSKKEQAKGDTDVTRYDGVQSLTVLEPKIKVDLTKYTEQHEFYFDEVFHEETTNMEIYRRTCEPLVDYVFKQGKATCFAYGQTGAGKTFTMMGSGQQEGLYVMAARDMFRQLSLPENEGLEIWVSFFEIYGGKLFDLLNNRKKLVAREDGNAKVNIVGLQEKQVITEEELLNAMDAGNVARSTAATGANADSSRSHAIMQVALKRSKDRSKDMGKFSFIDLAGSERASDTTDNDRQTRIESAEINKSLLALKECIRALDLEHRHIPFRGSKLTEVLKDSFLGECRTVMLANIAPSSSSCEHTMNTLRYANRVKELRKGALPPSLAGEQPAAPSAGFRAVVAETGAEGRRCASPLGGGGGVEEEEDKLARTHEELVYSILDEEDDIIAAHRQQIEDSMEMVQREMVLLQTVEQPGGSVDAYIKELDAVLAKKVDIILALRSKLVEFQQRLREEETLSKTLHPVKKK